MYFPYMLNSSINELNAELNAILSTVLTAVAIVLLACFIIKFWPRKEK